MGICFFRAPRVLALRLGLAGLALATGPLEGAVQLIDVSAAPALVDYDNRRIQIPQFDPSLGTLQFITIGLQGTGSFSERFMPFGRTPTQVMVDQNLEFTLETSCQALLDVYQIENHSYSFSGMGKRFRAGGFGDSHLYPVTAVGTQTLGSERDLNEFIGSGFLDLFLDAQGGVNDHFTRGTGILQGLVKAGADITVCYDYIPVSPQVAVPEVGTCLAGGFALLLLVLTRCRGQPRSL